MHALYHELWKTQLRRARESIVGQNIQLNGQSWQVIGNPAPNLGNPFGPTQVFAPRVFEVSGLTPAQIQIGAGYSQPIARLKPGISLERANAELTALSRNYAEQFGGRLDASNQSEARDFIARKPCAGSGCGNLPRRFTR